MDAIAILPNRYSRRREKVFGRGRCQPLDRNAKARIMVYARAWSARHKRPGQAPRAADAGVPGGAGGAVVGVPHSWDGRCFPSYEAIAQRAQCCRDTVYEAIKALEAAGVLTWANRLIRVQFRERDLFGTLALRTRLIRTSNAYVFRGLLPGAIHPNPQDRGRGGAMSGAGSVAAFTASENPPETQIQDFPSLSTRPGNPEPTIPDPSDNLGHALRRLQAAMRTGTTAV